MINGVLDELELEEEDEEEVYERMTKEVHPDKGHDGYTYRS